MNFSDVTQRLESFLRDAGCSKYTVRQALADAAECWRGIREDSVAHGESGDGPFFSFVVAESVGVFAFYGDSVDFYVIPGDEWTFRRHFDPLAMSEIETARALLESEFGRSKSDLSIDSSLSRAWLAASDDGTTAA